MRPAAPALLVLLATFVACGTSYDSKNGDGGGDGGVATTTDAGGGAGDAMSADASDATNGDGAAGEGGRPNVTTAIITSAHRFVPNAMFGGWGPHLGHVFRRANPDEIWIADDACDQAGGADSCDVNVNRRLDYFRIDDSPNATVSKVASAPLAGIQQNTGSILVGDVIYSYGVDVTNEQLVECTLNTGTLAHACAPIAASVGPSANYVGAAVSPTGTRVVWVTDVMDGGGGKFQWYADYGGGWNGPRTGDVAGYNDASYIHVAFGGAGHQNELTMNVQFVSGLAPTWTFIGGTGSVDVSTMNAAAWATNLAAIKSADPIISTDDVAVDPVTNDAHLFARTNAGDAVYYFRPSGGAWSAPVFSLPAAYRARLVFAADGTLYLAYGPMGKGLAFRAAPSSARTAGQPIDWTKIAEHAVTLPQGYASIDGIYPVSSVYQSASVEALRLMIVGDVRQNEALYVAIDP
jgi:hypothetical protein